MSKSFFFASLSVVFAAGVMLVGCSNQQLSQQQSTPEEHEGDEHVDSGHTDQGHDESAHGEPAGENQYEDALAQLSPADRALADKQKTCPVSGDPLGVMGEPYKVTVQGRDVMLCCSGCEAKIKENPDEYLAKLAP